MVLSIIKKLCKHNYNLILEHFHHPGKKPFAYYGCSPFLPLASAQATTNLLSASVIDLPVLCISCK